MIIHDLQELKPYDNSPCLGNVHDAPIDTVLVNLRIPDDQSPASPRRHGAMVASEIDTTQKPPLWPSVRIKLERYIPTRVVTNLIHPIKHTIPIDGGEKALENDDCTVVLFRDLVSGSRPRERVIFPYTRVSSDNSTQVPFIFNNFD